MSANWSDMRRWERSWFARGRAASESIKRTSNATDRTFAACLLVWNPLLAAAISFAVGAQSSFFRSWLVSLVIAEVVAVVCFASAHLFRWLELALYRLRERSAPAHGLDWHLVLVLLALPFALPVGFSAGGATARWLRISWSSPDLGAYRNALGFSLAMMLLFFLQRTRSQVREMARAAEARIKSLEAAQLQAQLSALTAQMNPHLLFNSLNTVAALIHSEPDRAEEVVLELSELYRGVLRSSERPLHSLQEELALCEAYLRIEQARFGARLRLELHVEPGVEARTTEVPTLLLQPFVENAVKHGISPRASGGRVELTVRQLANELELRVVDDGVGLGYSTQQGAGTAISNCQERLRLTYGDQARLEVAGAPGGGTCVTISVPANAHKESAAS